MMAADWLSAQDEVMFVERFPRTRPLNRWARAIVNNGFNDANYATGTGLLAWDAGLDGTGQVRNCCVRAKRGL